MSILQNIHGHDDLIHLTDEERKRLCEEIREFLVSHVSKTGGHLASNLGAVELTVAIETVFNTNIDRLVFDVGHQSYVHKLLTGRQADFEHLRQFGGIAGFPKPAESDADAFVAGHASSSVSIALGMAREGKLTASYFLGAGTVAAIGWIGGTALGAVAGSLLPESVRMAMSTLLYGMFVAIVIPQARAEKPMAVCLALALVFSCLFTWMPLLNTVSTGLAIVICTVAAAALCAALFPVKEDAQ